MPKSIHSKPYKQLLTLLVACRKAAGLSQYDLARRLGRPQSFVAKVEGSERRIDVVEFLEITSKIGTDPHEILRVVEETLANQQCEQ
jgi:transcriptional regulator with XRE-family HTH domain